MKKIISTKNAPAAIGPYNQGILAENFLFTSGMLGIDPLNGEFKETVQQQTEQAIKNIIGLLSEENYTLDDVIKTTVFIKNMGDFSKINEVYGRYFNGTLPARSCVEVARLPKDGLVEIEVIAYK